MVDTSLLALMWLIRLVCGVLAAELSADEESLEEDDDDEDSSKSYSTTNMN